MKAVYQKTMGFQEIWAALLTCLMLCGCGSGSKDDQFTDLYLDDGKMDTINPEDDENLGYLVVNLPSGAPSFNQQELELFIANTPIEIDKTYRLVKGSHPMAIGYKNPKYLCSEEVLIEAKKTTTYVLKLVTLSWDPQAFAVDFGPKASITLDCRTDYKGTIHPDLGADLELWAEKKLPLPRWVSTTEPEKTLRVLYSPLALEENNKWFGAPEDLLQLDLSPARDVRATIELRPPSREYPNATRVAPNPPMDVCQSQAAPCFEKWTDNHSGNRHFFMLRDSTVYQQMTYAHGIHEAFEPNPRVVAANPDTFHAVLEKANLWQLDNFYSNWGIIEYWYSDEFIEPIQFHLFPTSGGYEYVVNNITYAVTPNPGEHIVVNGKRIDINDVRITKEDGSVEYIKGRYTLKDQHYYWYWLEDLNSGFGNHDLNLEDEPVSGATKTGFDIPPGKYQVVVDYTTAEGPKSKTYDIDLSQ